MHANEIKRRRHENDGIDALYSRFQNGGEELGECSRPISLKINHVTCETPTYLSGEMMEPLFRFVYRTNAIKMDEILERQRN